jgi:hypothetical protein
MTLAAVGLHALAAERASRADAARALVERQRARAQRNPLRHASSRAGAPPKIQVERTRMSGHT